MTEKEGRGTQGRGPALGAHRCPQESAGDLGSQGRRVLSMQYAPHSPQTLKTFLLLLLLVTKEILEITEEHKTENKNH